MHLTKENKSDEQVHFRTPLIIYNYLVLTPMTNLINHKSQCDQNKWHTAIHC